MQRDARTYPYDIREAAELIVQFTAGRTFAEYKADVMLRSAVEPQFEIIGEALGRLAQQDQALTARIGEYRRIISFRNILIHAYAIIEDDLVWEVVQSRLPILRAEVDALLAEP